MKTGGLDIGSRYIKYVLLEDGKIVASCKKDTGYEPLSICQEMLRETEPEYIMATGYGRYLLEIHGNIKTITEIKAVARGAKELFPSCRTVVDIGGQDTKIICLNDEGNVTAFEMNDRCAAGTGKFLEIMANALGYGIGDFGKECRETGENIKINSMCAVFAESEVIGLITKGVDRESIRYAIHKSVVNKVISLIKRIGVNKDIVFAGGCARNKCLKEMFEEQLQREILVSENPDILAALGAALYAEEHR